MAADLVRLKVDVIVAGGEPRGVPRKESDNERSPSCIASHDGVGTGLFASLARPGDNVTGIQVHGTLVRRQTDRVLNELVLQLSRFAFLVNEHQWEGLAAPMYGAAHTLKLTVLAGDTRRDELCRGLQLLFDKERPGGILVSRGHILCKRADPPFLHWLTQP